MKIHNHSLSTYCRSSWAMMVGNFEGTFRIAVIVNLLLTMIRQWSETPLSFLRFPMDDGILSLMPLNSLHLTILENSFPSPQTNCNIKFPKSRDISLSLGTLACLLSSNKRRPHLFAYIIRRKGRVLVHDRPRFIILCTVPSYAPSYAPQLHSRAAVEDHLFE